MARSNAAGITVPRAAEDQLAKLVDLIGRVPQIIAASQSLQHGITIFQILAPFSARLNLPVDDLVSIFAALENLKQLTREYGSADDALDRIEAGIRSSLSARIAEKRNELVAIMQSYSEDNPVAITFKAQRLAYTYERIFRDGEILTDMRPVFDSSGKSVMEVIVGQTLVISAANLGTMERLHFAMDAGDVLKLRTACDRAIEKARSIQNALKSSNLDWKVQILRGLDDETTD